MGREEREGHTTMANDSEFGKQQLKSESRSKTKTESITACY